MKKIKPKTHEPMMDGPAKSDSKIYPRFRIDLEHLPEAKKWTIGKEYKIELKLKMTGISISKFQNDTEFDIVGIETQSGEKKETENED